MVEEGKRDYFARSNILHFVMDETMHNIAFAAALATRAPPEVAVEAVEAYAAVFVGFSLPPSVV